MLAIRLRERSAISQVGTQSCLIYLAVELATHHHLGSRCHSQPPPVQPLTSQATAVTACTAVAAYAALPGSRRPVQPSLAAAAPHGCRQPPPVEPLSKAAAVKACAAAAACAALLATAAPAAPARSPRPTHAGNPACSRLCRLAQPPLRVPHSPSSSRSSPTPSFSIAALMTLASTLPLLKLSASSSCCCARPVSPRRLYSLAAGRGRKAVLKWKRQEDSGSASERKGGKESRGPLSRRHLSSLIGIGQFK